MTRNEAQLSTMRPDGNMCRSRIERPERHSAFNSTPRGKDGLTRQNLRVSSLTDCQPERFPGRKLTHGKPPVQVHEITQHGVQGGKRAWYTKGH
jgi:hypothetical protein